MADDKKPGNSILGREPNSLDKIGSKSYTQSYMDQLAIMERRAAIETVEMRRLQQRKEELELARAASIRQQANVRAGLVSPSQEMFRGIGVSASATQEIFKKLPTSQIPTAFVRASERYEQDIQSKTAEISDRLDKMNDLRQVNAMRQFTSRGISIAGSESGISSLQTEPGVLASARRYSRIATDVDLQRGLERATRARRSAGLSLEESLSGVSEEGGREEYLRRAQAFEESKRKEAALMAAVGIQRRQRRDISGQIAYGESIESKIQDEMKSRSISYLASTGQIGSVKEETSRLRTAEEQFLSALDKFRQEFEKTGDVTKEVRDELEKSKDTYETQRKIVDEINRSGGGGGGGRFGALLSGARQAVGIAAYGAVTADIEQMQLRSSAAQFANREFLDYSAAARGNVAALRRITSGAYGTAADFGTTYGTRATVAGGSDLALAGVQGALDIASLNFGKAGQTGADAAKSAIDLSKGLTRARAETAMRESNLLLQDTVNQIPDALKQRFLDFRLGTFGNMLGTGSAMSRMYGGAVSAGAVGRYKEQAFDPMVGAALYGAGANLIGAQFTRDQGRADEITRRAMMLESRGVMSAQQYMANVGQFTQTGGTEKDFEDLLASAVARGVDDAKSLGGLAQSIQSLSAASAAGGIGIAPIVSQQMQVGMQKLEGLAVDETLKQNLIRRGVDEFTNMSSRMGTDIASMGVITALSEMGFNESAIANIGVAKVPEITALNRELLSKGYKKGSKVSRADVFRLGGISSLFVDPATGAYRGAEFIKDVVSVKNKYQIGTGLEMIAGAAGTSPEEISSIREKIERGDVDKLSIGEIIKFQDASGKSAAAFAAYSGIGDIERKDVPELTGEALKTFKTKQAMAKMQGEEITQAGDFAGGMENLAKELADKFTLAAEKMDAVASGLKGIEAAGKMTLDASQFDNSVNKFDAAVDRLLKQEITPIETKMGPPANRKNGTSLWDWTSGGKF